MNKEHYLRKGLNSGLPSRCPILEYCERHAWTIYFFSDYSELNYDDNFVKALQRENSIPPDFEEKRINIISEPPSWSKGKTHGMFNNMCPEVNLFDYDNRLEFAKGLACTDGVWDIELEEKFKPLETKHYSECLEFSKYLFDNKFDGIKKQTKQRKTHCFTYLMVNKKSGFHKIGISSTPKYREKTLRSEEPEIETVIARKFATRILAKDLENELHKKYSDKRVRGEWFDLNPQEINEIIQILTE